MTEPHLCADCVVVFDDVRGFHVGEATLGRVANTIEVLDDRLFDTEQGRTWWKQSVATRLSPGGTVIVDYAKR